MNETENFKVLVVVGRDTTEENFFKRIAPYLYDNFEIRAVYALGDPLNFDNSERFICFIAGVETDLWTGEAQEMRLIRKEDTSKAFGISSFDSMDDALEHAKEKYKFEYSDQIQAFRDKATAVYERFGYSTTEETEQFMITIALAQAGMLHLTRGLFADLKVPVLVLPSKGADGLSFRPIAILISDEVLENLEMPSEIAEGE